MKRYLLFFYNRFEPGGGMNDFIDDFDNIDQARERIVHIEKNPDPFDTVGADEFWHFYNAHIYDTVERRFV